MDRKGECMECGGWVILVGKCINECWEEEGRNGIDELDDRQR